MSDDLTAEVSTALRRIWWLPVLRGVVLLILGLFMLVQPLGTVKALVWVFGIFAILDGVIAIGQWLGNRKEPGAGWWLISGLVGIAFGVIAVVWTGPTAQVIFYLIALWVLVLGILAVIASVVLYRSRDIGWYWVLTFGLISFLFGLLLIMNPQTSVSIIVVLLGLFAFVGGVVLIVSGFATKQLAKQLDAGSATI
ncbi:HdeD family acid-resistance protein [Cellulomonas sp. ICMP 17802]|uniref:HdeD family acid-resistance protein n=1 Tax=Cellulomonas sp. ICMP 17802 TaxID=3239199 RepID=UPI00351B04CF